MPPLVGVEPRVSDFHVLHATVWTNSLFAKSLRTLDSYIVALILGLREYFGINRAWLQKDIKVWDFQQIGN